MDPATEPLAATRTPQAQMPPRSRAARVRFLWATRQWQWLVLPSLQTVEWLGRPAAQIVDKLRSTAECATVEVQGVTAATDSGQELLALATPVCLRANYRQQLVTAYAHLRKDHLILLCQDLGLGILTTAGTLKARIKSWANYEAPAVEHGAAPSPVDRRAQPLSTAGGRPATGQAVPAPGRAGQRGGAGRQGFVAFAAATTNMFDLKQEGQSDRRDGELLRGTRRQARGAHDG